MASGEEHDDVTEKSPKKTLWSLTQDFCDDTSAHGLGRILPVRHWTRTIFWSFLFAGAVTMLCLQIYTLFSKYQSRPLTTLVTMETSTSLPFPVVTICNFNAIKNSTLEDGTDVNLAKEMEMLLNLNTTSSSVDNKQRKRRANEPTQGMDEISPTSEYFLPDLKIEEEDFDSEGLGGSLNVEPTFLEKEKMAVYLAGRDIEILKTYHGHLFEDMVLTCTYRGYSCRNFTTWSWDTYWHYKYGNCFIFNSNKTKTESPMSVLKSNKPGPSHGLNLELNVQQNEYIGPITPEAGIRVDITTQGEMPFPLERGVSLAPGYATMIGLRKVVIQREDPFQNQRCLKTAAAHDAANLYTKTYNVTHSPTACKESCLAYNQVERCGCMEYRFPSAGQPICSMTDRNKIECISEVQKMFKENKLNCTKSCPPPCRQEWFKMSSSFANWPSDNYEEYFEEALQQKNKYLFTSPGTYRKNVLKLQVFFEELNTEVITEQLSYDLASFVSDIGGQLGLWIGFSVLTVAEFLELIMLLWHHAFKTCSKKPNVIRPQGNKDNQSPQNSWMVT